jgi:hypothetical protein
MSEKDSDGDEIMAAAAIEAPDVSHMSKNDLCILLFACGLSNDPSDRAFAKACRDELARRKD